MAVFRKPDVVALQELKSADDDFPASAIGKAGYGAVWRGQKTWNGVAILARNADPVLTRSELPGDRDDREGALYRSRRQRHHRHQASIFRTANPPARPKFDFKLAWLKRLKLHAAKFLKAGYPRGAGRRLQRRPDRARYLSDSVVGTRMR